MSATPRPLKPSSKIGANTVAPTTSMSLADACRNAFVRDDAIDDEMPPPSVAKHAPQMNAAMMSHHGSGSNRSTQRMKKRYVSTSGVTQNTPKIRPTSIADQASTLVGGDRVAHGKTPTPTPTLSGHAASSRSLLSRERACAHAGRRDRYRLPTNVGLDAPLLPHVEDSETEPSAHARRSDEIGSPTGRRPR